MADTNITTLSQLRALAEKSLLDSRTRISEVLNLVIPALESAQHPGFTVTLPAGNWDGRAQTIQNAFFLADSNYWYLVCGDADCYTACCETGVKADNITTDGQITFRCEITPEEDLTIHIIRLEVETEDEQP